MWTSLSDLLQKKVKKVKKKEILLASFVCYQANLIGKKSFIAHSFKDGVLTVLVKSQIEAVNLLGDSGQIINKINKKIGFNAVKKIKTKIKN